MEEVDDRTPIRRIRVDDDLWRAYGETVGARKRSTDLRRYMEWRVNNPKELLPGTRLPAVRRARRAEPEPAPKFKPLRRPSS